MNSLYSGTCLLVSSLVVSLAYFQKAPCQVKTKHKVSLAAGDPRKFGSLIIGPSLRANLEVLTADSLEGRETGEPGAQKAAAFIASRFKSIGLKPAVTSAVGSSYFQKVPLYALTIKSVSLQVGSFHPVYLRDFIFLPSRRGNSAEVKAAGMTIVPFAATPQEMEKNITSYDLKGRVVLISPNAKAVTAEVLNPVTYLRGFRKVLAPILLKTPAAIFLCDEVASGLGNSQAFKDALLDNKTLVAVADKPVEKGPVVLFINQATYASILSQGGTDPKRVATALSKNILLRMACGSSVRITNEETKVDAANVLGLLTGTDMKSETLVVSAHYDHLGRHNGKIYHGADDDGSGTAALLEIAEAFAKAKKSGHGTRRNILFLANVGEEKGLLGSEYYSEHPLISVSKTIADLNIDMIGRIDSAHLQDTNYVYVIGSGKLSSGLQALSESVNHRYGDLELDYRYDDPLDQNRFYYRSDHYNFAKLGVPIIFYFNGVHADYHEPSDTIDKIAFALYAKRARLVFYTAWELANSERRPVVDRVNDFK